jgi:hypothetical protein
VEGDVVSVERVIAAPAAELFRIVADADRHPEIDGSGTVVKAKAGTPHELTLGSTFGMSMKAGVPYSMSNTVIEFEQDRRIAWKTVLSGFLGRFIGGRIWRYEFEPVDGGTLGPGELGHLPGQASHLPQARQAADRHRRRHDQDAGEPGQDHRAADRRMTVVPDGPCGPPWS